MSAKGDARKLIKRIERAGGVVEQGRGAHLPVYVDGRHVATLSVNATKGHSGSHEATLRALRRAGLKL